MAVVVGIDSSTQSCTVEVRDAADGTLLGVGSAPHRSVDPPVSEQDPEDWWQAARIALEAAFCDATTRTSARLRRSDVTAVSVVAQCHGLVALAADGTVVRPAKLWNDTTSTPQARALRRRIGDDTWIDLVGSLPTAAFTLTKLAWLADHEPEALRRTAVVQLPHDHLTWRLSGRSVTDRSDASGTGYWSATTGTYLTDVLDLVQARDDWAAALPQVLGPQEAAGTLRPDVAAELDLPATTLVAPGAGDQHAAALGLGAGDGDLIVGLGTSGVVSTRSPTPVHDRTGRVDGVADATGAWLPLVCTLNAARVTDTTARWLGVDHDGLATLALAAGGDPERPLLVAFLDGERTPDLPDARGLLTGLTTSTSRESLALAAVEGVLLGLLAGRDALVDAGVTSAAPGQGRRLLITGGGARSAAFCQILADLTADAVRRPQVPESSARGACVQAAAVAAGADVVDVRDGWRPAAPVVAEPRPDRGVERLRERYDAAVDLVRGTR